MMSAGYVCAAMIRSTTEGAKVSVGTSRFLGAASAQGRVAHEATLAHGPLEEVDPD